jgi:pectinesterase
MMKSITLFFLFFSGITHAQKSKVLVVASDGSGRYTTVQAALDVIPANNQEPVTIFIKQGIYKERLILETGKNNVTLVGESRDKTILTFNNHKGGVLPNGDSVTTPTSASFFVRADNFKAREITFQNDAGFTAGQAVAVMTQGDKLLFSECNFKGFQDVLFCSGVNSRQYYDHCYIEGTTDFIFGPSTAVFQSCHIHSKKNSHVTAASTPRETAFGFVFLDCKLTADSGLNNVSLGRPWRPYSSVTYIRCEIGRHIIPEGWNNWRNPANEQTARYAEYKSFGQGGGADKRARWAHQLTDEEVERFDLKNIFPAWDPLKELDDLKKIKN